MISSSSRLRPSGHNRLTRQQEAALRQPEAQEFHRYKENQIYDIYNIYNIIYIYDIEYTSSRKDFLNIGSMLRTSLRSEIRSHQRALALTLQLDELERQE